MTSAATLVSLHVGLPQTMGSENADDTLDSPWTSGIYKRRVNGRIAVGQSFIEGDGQADLQNHGGPHKAICAYSADHYDHWRAATGRTEVDYGAFGENFTLRDLVEGAVCIGDTWRIGDLLLQVSQPRQPCWKLSRRWRIKDFAEQVIRSRRTGWYFRVLQGGQIEAGAAGALVERPYPHWTIEAANEAMYARPYLRGTRAALSEVPLLSPSWQRTLAKG